MKARTKRRQIKLEQKARKRREKLRRQKALGPSVVFAGGGLKMSEVIIHLAEPLVEEFGETEKDLEQLLTLTIVAWNFGLLPQDEQEREFAEIAKDIYRRDREGAAFFRWLCDLVAERKQRFYPCLDCFIVDYQITHKEGGVHLDVMYEINVGGGESPVIGDIDQSSDHDVPRRRLFGAPFGFKPSE